MFKRILNKVLSEEWNLEKWKDRKNKKEDSPSSRGIVRKSTGSDVSFL